MGMREKARRSTVPNSNCQVRLRPVIENEWIWEFATGSLEDKILIVIRSLMYYVLCRPYMGGTNGDVMLLAIEFVE
jgi:hypothetical protein